MLFHVTWEFIDTSEDGIRRSLEVFSKWQPPAGAEFKGFYGFADSSGGVALIEADSAARSRAPRHRGRRGCVSRRPRSCRSRSRPRSPERQSPSATRSARHKTGGWRKTPPLPTEPFSNTLAHESDTVGRRNACLRRALPASMCMVEARQRGGAICRSAKRERVTTYRSSLRATVAASAAPYGYTLTIWTSGAVLSHAHGIPNGGDALIFLIGAVAAFALIGGVVFGGLSEPVIVEHSRVVVWGGLHFVSVGAAIGVAWLVGHVVSSAAVWPIGGFLITALYLLGSALQLTVAQATGRRM